MPAYTSISFSFDRPTNTKFVKRFYGAFIRNGISFKSVMPWGCSPDKPLEEIIHWNQAKIDSNFIPGDDTDISMYTWQVYLEVPPFTECRLILSFDEDKLDFRCIVPECEFTLENSIIFERAALRIWDIFPVKLVETTRELDDDTGYQHVKNGVAPSTRPFAIIDDDCATMASEVYFLHEKLKRGLLLRPNPDQKEPIIVSETKRIARNIEALANEEVFPENYFLNNGIYDAVKHLVSTINKTDITLNEKDFHQLSFMAYKLGLDFPA